MTEAPRSEESTGKTRRRRTTGGVGVAEGGRPSVGAAPRIRAKASTGPELDAELDQIAKDLQQISAGARAPGVMPRQRKRDLREQLTRAQVHIRRATRAARAEAAGAMRSSASGKPGSASGSPGGGRISAARADQLSKLEGERRSAPTGAQWLATIRWRRRRRRSKASGLRPIDRRPRRTPARRSISHTSQSQRATPKRRCPRSCSERSLPQWPRPRRAARPLARIAGATALVVVAAVAGLLLGRSTGDNATSSQPAIAPASSQRGDYERAVGGQLQELAEARSSALERLRHAQSPAAQAAAGRDLAAAHRHAAVAIAATATPASLKAVRRRLVDGLTRLAHGYRKLARGAADQNAGGYKEGRRAVEASGGRSRARPQPDPGGAGMTARRRRGMLSGLALAGAGIVAALGAVSAPALPGLPPTASITASPNPALVNESVNFDGSGSTGDGLGSSITTYEWDLDGDNTFETNTGNNPTVSRSYSAPGTITVSLRVTDDDGDTDEDSVSLVVNSPPTAGFIYEPSTPAVNEQITFSSTSSDAEGPIPNSAQRWDFDNDGQFDDATGPTVTRAFSNPGTKSVGLRVTDSDGASATVVRNVVVQPNPPSAAFSFAPQSPLSGETVTFDGSGSTAPAGQTITAMNWDLDDDGAFDDGSWPYAQASYSTPGPHTVRLRVDASGGGFDIASQVVPVGNRPPTASFEFSPRPARAGEKLRLTSTSSDPDGPIVDTAWDLDGDGEFDDASGPTAQLRAPKHGTLTVGLEVVDSGGVSAQVTDSVPLRGGPRKLLAPFPVVRLAGELKRNGNTEIDRLSVRAPKGSDVTVGCHGRSCPFRSRTRAVKKRRVGFPGLERVLRPGVVIRVYVTDPTQDRKVHQLQAAGREGPKAHRQLPEGRAPQADSMPPLTRAAPRSLQSLAAPAVDRAGARGIRRVLRRGSCRQRRHIGGSFR